MFYYALACLLLGLALLGLDWFGVIHGAAGMVMVALMAFVVLLTVSATFPKLRHRHGH
jgi:hypothetical protein